MGPQSRGRLFSQWSLFFLHLYLLLVLLFDKSVDSDKYLNADSRYKSAAIFPSATAKVDRIDSEWKD